MPKTKIITLRATTAIIRKVGMPVSPNLSCCNSLANSVLLFQ
jgi:hypothetical protein